MFTKKILERKKITALIVSLILLFIFSFNLNNITTESNKVNNNLRSSALTSPIEIDDLGGNDWAWATGESWFGGGSGTSGDPYLLENLIIDGGGVDDCIAIVNSISHFTIKNCTVYNSGAGVYTGGIYLNNVTNGNIIENNCSNNDFAGICCDDTNSTIISNNIIFNNEIGILLEMCYYNEILENDIYDITNYYAIDLEDSPYNKIEGNKIRGCFGGIEVDHSNNSIIVGNIAEDNVRRGIYIYLSDNVEVTGNIFQNNTMSGIYLTGSSFNNISDNIAFNNTEHGIWIAPYNSDYSNGNIVTNNIMDNNSICGILLNEASENQILNNEISDNTYGAIMSPDADYNLFSENFFLKNKKHAYDYGANNDWNSLTIGNYWDNYTGTDANYDGIGDTPHNITGDSGSKDYLPIWDDGVPLINITSPLNNSNIGRDAPDFLVEITEPNLDTMWYTIDGGINDIIFTSNGTINQTSWETLWDSLAKGDTITIMFYANDTYGHLGSNFIVLIKHVPEDKIGLDFFATSLLILLTSGIAIIAIIGKIHFKKRIISH